ncbi:MAG: HPr family phosphocarrier protein [Oscillospiraceae bacterium]|nr:HPr family phosphocarrier protein [Oscillospiraceae bacterium]MCI1990295.1 HPr family phosphocarrier protein [Oscillospiraceae bacterium]MCI2035806.1 HPr family phosphocarrier protein [Oscillospiraceae bacterium]
MMTVKVRLDTVQKVKDFSAVIAKIGADCELIEGVRILDAKSIMGIFSLDLSKPIRLDIHSDDRKILDRLKDFLVEGPGTD